MHRIAHAAPVWISEDPAIMWEFPNKFKRTRLYKLWFLLLYSRKRLLVQNSSFHRVVIYQLLVVCQHFVNFSLLWSSTIGIRSSFPVISIANTGKQSTSFERSFPAITKRDSVSAAWRSIFAWQMTPSSYSNNLRHQRASLLKVFIRVKIRFGCRVPIWRWTLYSPHVNDTKVQNSR